MESQAGELSEGCRATEPARNCTQYSQRKRTDTAPSLPNTLSSLHLLLLNSPPTSAPTKKSSFSSSIFLLLHQLCWLPRLRPLKKCHVWELALLFGLICKASHTSGTHKAAASHQKKSIKFSTFNIIKSSKIAIIKINCSFSPPFLHDTKQRIRCFRIDRINGKDIHFLNVIRTYLVNIM